jgi:hypothetical protein
MKPTIKIRFTEPQIAFVMRAHPNCNLDRLTEVSFEFDQAGKIIDCIGTIKDGGNIDHNYAGSGLARLYERARRRLAARQTSGTIVQFPHAERQSPHHAPQMTHGPRTAGPPAAAEESAVAAPLERGMHERASDNAREAEKGLSREPMVGEMRGGA